MSTSARPFRFPSLFFPSLLPPPLPSAPLPALAADKAPKGPLKIVSPLCDDACFANIDKLPVQTTASGLKFVEIVEGKGPTPKVGYQITCK